MEPVTLEQVKLYCRIDNTAEDALISAMIVAAREAAEARAGRPLRVEDFPDGAYPESVRTWILIQLGTLYENRERYSEKQFYELKHVDRLLDGVASPRLS